MGKQLNRLTTMGIQKLTTNGLHHDGDGLYLQITKNKNKSWIFRYAYNGNSHYLGLGPSKYVSLAEARQKRNEYKKQLINRINPIEEKNRLSEQIKRISQDSISFQKCAEAYIQARKLEWTNEKHIENWNNSLKNYAYPIIGNVPVKDIDLKLVLKVLEPVWYRATETGNRVRGRIETILNWAAVREYRSGENPARWKGHLDQILPKKSIIQKVKHMEALDYQSVPDLIILLDKINDTSALALQFLILNAARTNEVIYARWSEIDFIEKTWTIPSERMKSKREHKVPLTETSIKILKLSQNDNFSPFIFRQKSKNCPLTNFSMLHLLQRLRPGKTVHGFRSSFRDWAGDETNHPREVAEAALAHVLKNKVEAAYRRSDSFTKRRVLMTDWEKHCYKNHRILFKIGAP
jgi:integrase